MFAPQKTQADRRHTSGCTGGRVLLTHLKSLRRDRRRCGIKIFNVRKILCVIPIIISRVRKRPEIEINQLAIRINIKINDRLLIAQRSLVLWSSRCGTEIPGRSNNITTRIFSIDDNDYSDRSDAYDLAVILNQDVQKTIS